MCTCVSPLVLHSRVTGHGRLADVGLIIFNLPLSRVLGNETREVNFFFVNKTTTTTKKNQLYSLNASD